MDKRKRKNSLKRFSLGKCLWYVCGLMFLPQVLMAQADALWHNQQRKIRYQPEGESFVGINGERRFNRALYGTNTAYRTEAGDKPEFALYMPGMGGNLKLGVLINGKSKWLSECAHIKAIYIPGSMKYELRDELFGQGILYLHILSRADADGLILKVEGQNIPDKMSLIWLYGGATGRKFSRDGDIGADPESVFYLHPEYCKDNQFNITKKGFSLLYGSGKVAPSPDKRKQMRGDFPEGEYKLADAAYQSDPSAAWSHKAENSPVFAGKINLQAQKEYYFSIYNPETLAQAADKTSEGVFNEAEMVRQKLAGRISINTPDEYINTLGGALAVAADAVWESPTFLHGAVAWRMRLNAWRGAYAADVLGWHDRAKLHFDSYANSQVLQPESGPIVPDTSRHFARQLEEMGTAMFSSGYISRNPNANNRPHHYDMNLVFFDQMFNYFNWTGDTAFLKKMWPVLERHMAWEKRNFDQDGDGLYDAYAAIWASDALQYSGGGVTHTSAYNYRANLEMARLAKIIGRDDNQYRTEANHILKALQSKLWLSSAGTFAEFKDLLGNQLLHTSPGLWTIYHAIDAKVPDDFQAYQMLKYVDRHIPHIPIKAQGLSGDYYTLSTTNWQPYTWSVNNVALAELLHTSLAFWQGNDKEEAFRLWKSSLMESMYLGASPGNFQQLSFYDAVRGELYRDFADPVGMAARSLVEGLYGIQPDLLNGKLNIRPGLPHHWDFASLKTPDISYDFKQGGNTDVYSIAPHFGKTLDLTLQLSVYHQNLKTVKVNGKEVSWKQHPDAVGHPEISIQAGKADQYVIELVWSDELLQPISFSEDVVAGKTYEMPVEGADAVYDPQKVLKNYQINKTQLNLAFNPASGHHTFFVKARQGSWTWWQAVDVNIRAAVEWQLKEGSSSLTAGLQSHINLPKKTELWINGQRVRKKFLLNKENNYTFQQNLQQGSNRIQLKSGKKILSDTVLINWDIAAASVGKFETWPLQQSFNARVNQIFEQKYLSPRPQAVTLQLPWQGIGNWCYPWIQPEIDDSGLKEKVKASGQIYFQNIPFQLSPDTTVKDIAFVSKWDNYPDSLSISASGKARHAYFLMAGTSNHMQSRMTNGLLEVRYADGTSEQLLLKNPENWWPIEQDYVNDGFAFTTDAPRPPRLLLKSGEFVMDFDNYQTIKGFSSYGIEGGAATLLDMPLDPSKNITSVRLKAEANDVVIGLMALTFIR